jgi:hypothetical protein
MVATSSSLSPFVRLWVSSKPRALAKMHVSSVADCGFFWHCARGDAATAGGTAVYVN